MPIIQSAIKRVRQTKVRTARNASRKRLTKETLKDFLELIATGKVAEAVKMFPSLQKAIDLMVKNNLWHANKAARMKSNLSKKLPSKTTTPKTAPKAPAKKSA